MGKDVRKPLEKIFANMEWLDFGQAAKYLSVLTDTRQKYDDMMGLVTQNALPCYIDFSGMQVEVIGEDADAPIKYATGKGLGKLEVPLWRDERGQPWVYATGSVVFTSADEEVAEARFRLATSEHNSPALQFRREDIQKLASEAHPAQEKPIDVRERKSIEQIIAVLADMPTSVDISKTSKACGLIRAHAAGRFALPTSDTTIEKHLKAAATRVESDRQNPPEN